MKKIVLTVIAALTMSMAMAQSSNQQGNSNGQRRGLHRMDATEMTERMAKELGLDDSQKKEVLSLNKDFVEQMQKQQSSFRENRQEYEKKLKKILTADQQQTYEQSKKNRMRARRGNRSNQQ